MTETTKTNTNDLSVVLDELIKRTVAAEIKLEKAKLQEQLDARQVNEGWGEFYAALARAQSQFTPVKKSEKATIYPKNGGNPFTYYYAKLTDILSMAEPKLNAEGIFFSQHEKLLPSANVTFVVVVTELMFKNGLKLSRESYPLQYNVNDYQGVRSIVTSLRRYCACDLLGIEADTDDDGRYAQGNYYNSQNGYSSTNNRNGGGNRNNYQQRPQNKNGQGQSNQQLSCPKQMPSEESTVKTSKSDMAQEKSQADVTPKEKVAANAPSEKIVAPGTSHKGSDFEVKDSRAEHQQRNVQQVLEDGLLRAKQVGATEEQLENWKSLPARNAISEISKFVLKQLEELSK